MSARAGRPRLLFLSRWFPWPADNGSRLRIYNLLCAFSADFDITLLSFHQPDDATGAGVPDALQALCRRVERVAWRDFQPDSARARLGFAGSVPRSMRDTHSPEMAAAVRRALPEHDLVLATQFNFLPYLDLLRGRPVILDELELGVQHDQFAQAGTVRSRLRYGLTWFKLSRYVRRQLRHVAVVTVVSERERALAARLLPPTTTLLTVANGIDPQHYENVRPLSQPQTLLYTGALSYRANYAAVAYFLRDIWPRVAATVPQAQFRITGRYSGSDWPPVPVDERVALTGYLDDIRPILAGATASVVPLTSGGGTRLKILEAMALRTPVVATPKGAEGLGAVDGEHLLIGHDAEQFAARTVRLLTDAGFGRTIAANAHAFVHRHYAWPNLLPPLLDAAHRLVGAR